MGRTTCRKGLQKRNPLLFGMWPRSPHTARARLPIGSRAQLACGAYVTAPPQSVFCEVTPCSPVAVYRCYRGTFSSKNPAVLCSRITDDSKQATCCDVFIPLVWGHTNAAVATMKRTFPTKTRLGSV